MAPAGTLGTYPQWDPNYIESVAQAEFFVIKNLESILVSLHSIPVGIGSYFWRDAIHYGLVQNSCMDSVAAEAGKDPSQVIATFRIPGSWEGEGFKILARYGVNYCDRSVSMYEAAGRAVSSMGGA